METFTFTIGEHVYVYRFYPKQTSEFVWRLYRDSRDPRHGFSLSYVLQAIRSIG